MTEKQNGKKGNPNPSPATRFGVGNRANPNGKTSEQKRLELANAEAAMRIRERILRAAEAKLNECSTDEVLDQFVDAAMLKLLKDSEDRGLGAPVQAVTNPDGSLRPQDTSAAVLAALQAKHATKPE
jgi:Tfp pilus assembly protein PilX